MLATYVSPSVHQFFHRGVFGGTPGAMNATVANFIDKLQTEWKKRKLPENWEPENEKAMMEILDSLNFNKPKGKKANGN